MLLTKHFLEQAHHGSVPTELLDALALAPPYPPDSAIVLGRAERGAIVIAIIRLGAEREVVCATCLTRCRKFTAQQLRVKHIFELNQI